MIPTWRVTETTIASDAGCYDRARADLTALLTGTPGVQSIVEYGSVSAPGVSDLDLIVGLSDEADERTAAALSKEKFPHHVREAIGHANLIMVPHSTLPKIGLWGNWNTNVLFGGPIEFETFNSPELAAANIVDWLPERICRLLKVVGSRQFETRIALGLLRSALYSLDATETLTKVNRAKDIAPDILSLRAQWSTSRQWRSIPLLLHRTIDSLHLSWRDFREWCFYTHPYGREPELQGTTRFFFPDGTAYRFSSVETPPVIHPDGRVEMVLPPALARHFTAYAGGNGPISREMRRGFESPVTDGGLPTEMAKTLAARIALVNEWAEFLMQRGFRFGLMRMGWFYSP